MNNISIVIPTYGRDAVLVDSIKLLLSLPQSADEVLVVDQSASHDKQTDAALYDWDKTGKIRWIRHQPPGHVGALNKGMQEACHSVVLFLDDDIVPDASLVDSHRNAHAQNPSAWAVVGRVIQGGNAEKLKTEKLKRESQIARSRHLSKLISVFASRFAPCCHGQPVVRILTAQHFSISAFQSKRDSALRKDLHFDFSGEKACWVENVMTGNLSVKRAMALSLCGFDEKFIPPVSFRAETDFAKRMIAAGGRIRFEPKALIHHLRVSRGGTRIKGGHLASASPLHGVGDYYYAMKHGKGFDRFCYIVRRPFREVCTRFHVRHPWWIPVKFIGELRAICLAAQLIKNRR